MALIITPRQLELRSQLYHQIAAMTSAGLGLLPALEMLSRQPPSRAMRKPLAQLVRDLNAGYNLAETLKRTGRWLPSFDISLLEAGEKSGRLDACFKLLSDYYEQRAKLARKVIKELGYPLFVIHAAVLIFPVNLFTGLVLRGEEMQWLTAKLATLIPLYLVVFLLVYACQGRHGVFWRSLVERFFNLFPIVRTARRSLALSRLSAALEALISAGVLVVDAWDLAALSSGSPALHRAIAQKKPLMLAGETPGEVLSTLPEFPELFTNLYRTGELSGKIDTTLVRLRDLYAEEGARKMTALAEWMPRLIYLAIVLLVAQQIVGFYSGYFGQVNELIK